MSHDDLHNILDTLCERHLGRTLDVEIRWSERGEMGDDWWAWFWKDGEDDPEIVVNVALKARRIPRYVVEHIVWHEACHAALYEMTGSEAREHGASFHVLEVLYPSHARAMTWFDRHEIENGRCRLSREM